MKGLNEKLPAQKWAGFFIPMLEEEANERRRAKKPATPEGMGGHRRICGSILTVIQRLTRIRIYLLPTFLYVVAL
jgi:hypothetical protein